MDGGRAGGLVSGLTFRKWRHVPRQRSWWPWEAAP